MWHFQSHMFYISGGKSIDRNISLSYWLFIDYCFLVTQWLTITLFFGPQGHMFTSVQSLSSIQLFVTPWTATGQASLSITNSQSLPKLKSIKSVMPSNHLIFYRPLLLPPSIFPSIRVFSNESVLHIRWPKYWSFNFSITSSSEYLGLISFRADWSESG